MSAKGAFLSRLIGSRPLRIASRPLQRLYARALGAAWRVDLKLLFDEPYYLGRYADVAASGMDPLFHFLWTGCREGRKPHPLFDPAYYVGRYPDVTRRGVNPLIHYLRFGGAEGRQPHPGFDGAYYLNSNPDVAATRANPLAHFMQFGALEGRKPHPEFDFRLYLAANPDVAAAHMNPLLHFAMHGAGEERPTSTRGGRLPAATEDLLPVPSGTERAIPGHAVDVVIPIYKGVQETRACLASVLAGGCETPFRVVAVNDCSPEPELGAWLRELARDGRIELIENSRNLGFVESVNAGMRAGESDVVLLNSDTLVFPGWLDRLAACAYDGRTGSVSPFSNNATICSYPEFCADNPVTVSDDLAALDRAFDEVNRGRSVDVPTTVGFCMYIRRDCLRDTGLFDAEAFGHGYGEENDFCMRSAAKGWRHKLACDVFVYHAGSVSFGADSPRRAAAMRTLIDRHPEYPRLVQRHVEADPANGFRLAVTAHRIRNSGRRVFLAVAHPLGGGVAQHIRELMEATAGEALWLLLKPLPPDQVSLECADPVYRFRIALDTGSEYALLLALLRACGLERGHIHHLMGHSLDLQRLMDDLGTPFDFTVHDYYTICPQVTLTNHAGHYCGEPAARDCDACLVRRPPVPRTDIRSWRARCGWAVARADRVIAPSADTAARIGRYFPQARVIAAEHEGAAACGIPSPRALGEGEALRVAVLGTLTIHKGFSLFRECCEAASRAALPIEFLLIGTVEPGLPHREGSFRQTGAYQHSELTKLLETMAPHLVWFPGGSPETFSYTLSACLDLGLPVAAHDIGAFPERLAGRPWTWVVPRDLPASGWLELLQRIRNENFLAGAAPPLPPAGPRARLGFYPAEYLKTPRPAAGRISVAAALASQPSGELQACAHVRVVQPLTHPAIAPSIQLVPTPPSELPDAAADAVLVQRTSVQDVELARRIVDACRRRGAPLVYETDDDLFGIPPEHPEYDFYRETTRAARILAAEADAVIVSTAALGERMAACNRSILTLPNCLDERLWRLGPRQPAPAAARVRILFAGTSTHRADLEFLGRAFWSLPAAVRKRLEICVAGIADEAPAGDWFTTVRIPPECARSYPRYAEWMQQRNDWHWGAAVLLDTPFNRAKSALKFLEYSALGLASICSNMPVYRDAVRPEETGLLARNDVASWRDALTRAASDDALRVRLSQGALQAAAQNTWAVHAGTALSVWARAAGRAARPALTI